jgi:predicted O-methyltransferase YrrM
MRVATISPGVLGLRNRLGRMWTLFYNRASLSGHVPSVPPWACRLAPSGLQRAFAWRAAAVETEVQASLGADHWLRPAMDRVSGWSISPMTLLLLGRFLEDRRPTRIVEFGGGVSTLAFATHASREAKAGRVSSVISFEHDADWLDKTRAMLDEFGLAEHVEFVHAPLAEATVYGRRQVAYAPPVGFDTTMSGGPGIDLVFIDGPPGTTGRLGSLAVVEPYLADGAMILLDDAFREGERRAWATWRRETSGRMRRSRILGTSRGLASASWVPSRVR